MCSGCPIATAGRCGSKRDGPERSRSPSSAWNRRACSSARIADPDLPFGGTWTYEITPDGGGSRLTITEDGEIYNPLFRFMARFVFGYEGTIASYMSSLEKRLAGPAAEGVDLMGYEAPVHAASWRRSGCGARPSSSSTI